MNKLFTKAFGIPMASLSLSLILLGLFTFAPLINKNQPIAQAATSSTLNFQSRLLTSSGNTVPDGNYHIEFKLYNANNTTGSSQGSCTGDANCLWTETRTTGNLVRVVNGYLTVNLGSVTAFPSTIDWDQEHWLGMRVGGSGGSASWETIELTSDGTATGGKLKLTAVPYAFKAGQLAKRTGGNTSTLDFDTQTGSRVILLPDASGTVCLQAASACGFATTTGGTGYIQNQNAIQQTASNFWISGNGQVDTALLTPLIDTATNTTLNIGTNNATDISLNQATSVASDITFSAYGDSLFRPATDSPTSFQIQNSASVNLFSADTANMRVIIGDSTNIVSPVGQLYVAGKPAGSYAGNSVGTGLAQSVYVQGRYVYAVNIGGSSGIHVYDSTDLTLVGSSTWTGGAMSVYVQGRYAYLADGNNVRLRVVDVYNPSTPTAVGNASTTGGFSPQSVYVQGRYAYVVGGSTLEIFDVANPASPAHVGNVSTLGGSYSVQVQGRYAYVANRSNNTFQIFDINNPASPVSVGSVATDTAPQSVYVQGRYAYIANYTSDTMQIIDIYDPTNPVIVSTTGTGDGASSVYVQGRYAYVTNYLSGDIVTIDVSSPYTPTLLDSSVVGTNLNFVHVQGRYAYVTDYSGDMQQLDLGGAYVQQLETGGIDTGTLSTGANASIGGSLSVQGGLIVGDSTQLGSLGVSGQTLFQTTTNSPAAFQLQNSSGVNLLSADTSTPNLLTNPSFEATTNGWVQRGTATITQSTAQKYFGLASMSVATASGTNNGVKYNYSAMTSTTQYSLSFYAKLSSGTFATMQAGHWNGSGETNCMTGQTVSTTQWTRYTCTFTTGTVSGLPYIYIKQSDAGTARTFFIDGVQLELSSAATNYKPGTIAIDGTINSFLTLQNSVDSTNSFQIQNAAGTTLLNANTINSRIGIGTSAPAYTLDVAGTANASTSVLTPLLDTASAVALNIGTTNATAINLNQNTTVAANKSLTVTSGLTSLTGATTGDALNVSNSTSTGNIAVFKDNSTAVATIADGGSVLFQNSTNSATAFQVQNTASEQVLNVNTAPTINLLTNSSIEVNTTGWASKISATITRDTAEHYVGNASLKVVTPATTNDGVKYAYSLASNTAYTFSFHSKLDNASAAFSTMALGWSNDGSTDSNCLVTQTVVKTGWTKYSCTFTTGTTSGSPYIYIKQTSAAAKTFYVDGLQLESGSYGTNLVSNLGFETDTSGWTPYNAPTLTRTTSQANTGSASLQIDSSAGDTGNEGALYYISNLVPNTQYSLKMYVRLDAGSPATSFGLKRFIDGSGEQACSGSTPTISSSSWQLWQCTFTTDAIAPFTNGYFAFVQTNNLDQFVTSYIDDVSVTPLVSNPYTMAQIALNGVIASPAVFQGGTNSTTAFQIQNSSGTQLLVADTINGRIAIGQPKANYTLDVGGDINISGVFRIKGTQIASANLSDNANLAKLNTSQAYASYATNVFNGTTLLAGNTAIGPIYGGATINGLSTPTGIASSGGVSGSTTWTYVAVAVAADGTTSAPSSIFSNSSGNATLNGSNYNYVTIFNVPGAISYKLYRTVSGGTPSTTGLIATLTASYSSSTTLNDTGLVGDGSSPPVSDTSAHLTVNGNTDISGSLSTKKGTDYSTIAGNNAALGNASLIRLTGASAQTITGIASGTDGRRVTLLNASGFTAVIANNSGSSLAANRITTGTGADVNLSDGASIELIYDSTASLWRVVGSTASGAGGSFIQNGVSPQTADFNITGDGTIGDTLTVTGLLTANGGITLQASDTFTINGDAFTDLTGSGLSISSGSLIVDDTSATGFFRNGGNSFAGAATLGTNDANVLNLETNTVNRFQISASASTLTGQGTTVVNSTGTLSLNSASGSNLNLGNTSTNSTIQIGNVTGTTGLSLFSGTNGVDITSYDGIYLNATDNIELAANVDTSITSGGNTAVYSNDTIINSQNSSVNAFQVKNSSAVSQFNVNATTGLVTVDNDLAVNGGDLTTSQTSFNLLNTTATTINAFGAATAINIGAAGGSTVQGAGNLTLQSAGTNTLALNTAGAGTVNLGTTNTTTVGIGSSVAAVTIQGNATSGAVSVQASAGGTIAIGSTTDAILNLGTGATTNAITIGGTSTAGILTLGQSTVTNTINIGSGNGTTATQTVNIAGGTSTTSGGKVVNIANGVPGAGTTNTVNIGTGGSTTGTVGVTIGSVGNAAHTTLIQGGSGTGAITLTPQTTGTIVIGATAGTGQITLGSSSATQTVVIGNGAGASTVSIGNNTQVGSTVNIAGANTATSITDTINIGTGNTQGTGNKVINIGSGTPAGTGANTITVGSTGSSSSTTVRGGSNGVTIQSGGTTGSTNAFRLQNAAGTETYFQVDNSNTGATNNITIGGNNSGKLGSWTTNTSNPLPAIMGYQSTVSANGYIYAIGGIDGTARTQVYYAKVNTNGSIGTWTATTALPSGRGEHSSIVANGYVYVIGGYDGGAINDVLYAKLNADGTLGSWNATTDLPYGLDSHSTVAANGYVYIIGGFDGTNNHGDVYYAKLNADGTVGTWTATVSLPGGERRTWTSSVTYNGYVYVMGGKDNAGAYKDTVYYARLNTDGTVGSWSTTSTLTQPRAIGSAVVANGYVYYLGGENTSTNNVQSTVYYAKINTDGTVGTWNTNTTNPLPAARDAHSSVVINGYVYVLGGYSGSAWLSSIYYSSTQRILMGGSLDLVSLGAGTLADGESGLGGSLTAGNTNIVGSLDVKGATNLGAGVNVTGNSNFNLLWNTGFNIQDAAGNSMFSAVNDPNGSFIELGHSYLTLSGVPTPVNPTVASANDAGATLAVDTYYYRVASYDVSGLQSVAVATTPVSITNPDTTTRHTISWTPVAGAAGYVVDRSSDGGATFTRENVGNVSSIIDNGITYDWVSSDYAANGRISYSSSVTLQNAGAVFFDIDNYTYINKNQSRSSLDIINLTGDVQMVGDNLVFQSTATYQDVFGITTGGEAWFGVEGADSATAFNIQSDTDANLFVVNSVTNRVHIGDPTADANAVQLVLDNKNTSGDPTGVDGAMYYNSNAGRFRCYEGGAWKECNHRTVVRLTADQGNSNGTANTMEDVTGLSWSVTANTMYSFSCTIYYTSAATTTGSRWAINGPAGSGMMQSEYTLTSTTSTINAMVQAYDSPATSNASSAAGTNLATLSGFVVPTSSGTIIVRHASEVSGSAITAKAGSNCEWW